MAANNDVSREYLNQLCTCIDECSIKINHCCDQLTDEQVWWRPQEEMNAIGNLLLHLCGNLRQWIIAGVGNKEDTRDRPSEFSCRSQTSKIELLNDLRNTLNESKATLNDLTVESLLQQRRIQGFEITGLAAAFDSVSHLKGHTQEIIHMTRVLLAEDYQFHWQPQTTEEGA